MSFFEERSLDTPHGGISYKLFLPKRPRYRPPLLIMLHGCTQNPDDFALGTRMNELAGRRGWIVAYPRQEASQNSNLCWNWFRPANQTRSGEAARITALAEHLARTLGADRRRVFVAGLSAGAAMTAILARAYPERFAAVGICAGVPVGAASSLMQALGAMQRGAGGARGPGPTPTIIFHGTADTTVSDRNGDRIALASDQLSWPRLRQRMLTRRGLSCRRIRVWRGKGHAGTEYWKIGEMGHAWPGGDPRGSYSDPRGPDASRLMLAFFTRQTRFARARSLATWFRNGAVAAAGKLIPASDAIRLSLRSVPRSVTGFFRAR
ncbi:MAG: PHB depolymerase family esterase [Rhodobacteraceae bacterium]|nr:PHB depolymerase family esterase [Paracoccaceae bacterium]